MRTSLLAIVLCIAAGLAGCQNPAPSDMTFGRGAQLLAAGSPKSAIPLLTQTVAATPDGPEPLAFLALAYALDLQPDRAIAEAALIKRGKDSVVSWEGVAVGIAEMTRHRPVAAIASLQNVVAANPGNPVGAAARQWLALAQLLGNQHDEAIASLKSLEETPGMRTTSLLWTALIHAHHARKAECAATLAACAKAISTPSGEMALAGNLTKVDDQTLYDAAVAALSKGDLDQARRLFALVHQHNTDACDANVWVALIDGAREDWQACRMRLKGACEEGIPQSRGLANQLYSVIAAIEDRPDAMVQFTLAGQRMQDRAANSSQTVDQPRPESVWGSDHMK